MTCHVYLNSEFGRLRIETDDDGALSLASRDESVSLKLSDADRRKLRGALDEADRMAAQQVAA